MCRINLTGLLDGGDFCHTAEEEQKISTLIRGVTVVDALQDAQVRPRIQLLGAGRLLLGGNRLVYHLKIMYKYPITLKTLRVHIKCFLLQQCVVCLLFVSFSFARSPV